MDNINLEVLKQLQEYASVYFNAIVELNSVNGKCNLPPGKYSAKEMAADPYKTFGQYYALPQDNEFDEEITVQSGTFHASFPYRQIFRILNEWENMCRAGKLKAIFEIEGAEEKTVPVVLNERTALGTLKTKKMKLQRIAGNWWKPRKIAKNTYNVTAYYELNGVMFPGGGKTFYADSIDSDKTREWCETWNDEKMIGVMQSYIKSESNSEEYREYYREVLQMAGISTEEEPETPQISNDSAKAKEVSAEEEKREETANYRISRYSHDDYTKIIVGDRSQSKVIAILLTIGNKSYIEINDESAGLATIGQKPLQTAKPITELTDKEVLELIYGSPQPPTDPPQDTQTDGRHDIPQKPKESARNVSVAPPGIPKDTHIISGPPGFKFIITPTINKNLILHNHDRNNCLAPPHLHNRGLRLPRLHGDSGYNLRHLCVWNPHIVATCQVDRQTNRGSPHRPGEGDRRMGTPSREEAFYPYDTGRERPLVKIKIKNLNTNSHEYFQETILTQE